jgi:hypothetical protein
MELRDRLHLDPGAHLLLLETPSGIVLLTREQARKRLQDRLTDVDLVGELLADRRDQAAAEDTA